MLSVADALKVVAQNCRAIAPKKVGLVAAAGHVLAENIYAPIDMPPFRQSAMDGYAYKFSGQRVLSLVGEQKAGDGANPALGKDEAVRIFTGARIPDDADTVVIQEHVKRLDGKIEIQKQPKAFNAVRDKGEQLQAGGLALEKNSLLNAAAIGFLASLGLEEVMVYGKPKVCLVLTGDELMPAGTSLAEGQIYESNALMLKAAVANTGIAGLDVFTVKDDLQSTVDVLRDALEKYDSVLISGGISVGDYDFVREALIANAVKELFYKVNQKPGKPLWFGKKDEKLVFALPGNPASSLSCFYIYVLPALNKMMGRQAIHLAREKKILSADFTNKFGKHLFLKGVYEGDSVQVQLQQASSKLMSFAKSNCLISIPADCEHLEAGQKVECVIL